MEKTQKRKITVDIAGLTLTLITDECDSFVDAVVAMVNERMASASHTIRSSSRMDAALLCAIDACGEKLRAEKRIRNLEAQISLYEVDLRTAREELAAVQKKLDEATGKTVQDVTTQEVEQPKDGFARLSDMLRSSGDSDEGAQDKIQLLERYLDSRKSGEDGGMTRDEKIRYIESLLRSSDPTTDSGNPGDAK